MVLQERDIEVLHYLARYFMLNSRQIRQISFPDDTTGRITRRRLNKMVHAEYIRRRRMQTVSMMDGAATPVYHLTRTGREFLAAHLDDDELLLKPIEPSQPQHLFHYTAVAETHRLFDVALQSENRVKVVRWVNEDEPIFVDGKKTRLRTEFPGSSKVVCIPDAAFLLKHEDHHLTIYLEQDRDTFFHDRVAARKSPGYRELLKSGKHRSHFPNTTLDQFLIMFVVPSAKRADQLCRAFAKKNKDESVAKLYRFGAYPELVEANPFFDPLWRCCHRSDPAALVRATHQ